MNAERRPKLRSCELNVKVLFPGTPRWHRVLGTTHAMNAFLFQFPTFGLCPFVTLFRFGFLSAPGPILSSLSRFSRPLFDMASLPGMALNLGQSTLDLAPLQLSQISLICHATVVCRSLKQGVTAHAKVRVCLDSIPHRLHTVVVR